MSPSCKNNGLLLIKLCSCSMIVNSPVGSPIGNDRPDTQPVADLSMHYGESIELKPRA